MAEDLGDQDKAKQIQDQLNELEERAEALDRQRTKNISAIRCVIEPIFGPQTLAKIIRQACGLYTLCCTDPIDIWVQGSVVPSFRRFIAIDSSFLLTPQLHQPTEPGMEHCRVWEGPCGKNTLFESLKQS